jgi:hypothetical protein
MPNYTVPGPGGIAGGYAGQLIGGPIGNYIGGKLGEQLTDDVDKSAAPGTPFDPNNPEHMAMLEAYKQDLSTSPKHGYQDPITGKTIMMDAEPAVPLKATPKAPGPSGPPKAGPQSYSYSHSQSATMPQGFGYTPSEQELHGATYDYLGRMGTLDKKSAEQAAYAEEQKAQAFQAHYARLAEQQAVHEEREKERQWWVQSALMRHEKEASALSKQSISTTHWWDSKNTEEKIVAGIGMALMAFGDAVGATANRPGVTMQTISGLIDRDIAVQKANLDNKWQGHAAKKGLFAARMAAFQDERVAEASAKASAWELVGAKVRAMEQTTSSEVAKTQVQKVAEQADFMREKYLLDIGAASEHAWQTQQAKIAAAQQAAAAEHAKWLREQNKADDEVRRKLAEKYLEVNPGKLDRAPDGTMVINTGQVDAEGKPIYIHPWGGGNTGKKGDHDKSMQIPITLPDGTVTHVGAASDTIATRTHDTAKGLVDYISSLDKMIAIAESGDGQQWKLGTSKGGEYDEIRTAAIAAWKESKHLGAYDKGVEALADKAIPERPFAYWTAADKAKLKGERETAKAELSRLMTTGGVKPPSSITPLKMTEKK